MFVNKWNKKLHNYESNLQSWLNQKNNQKHINLQKKTNNKNNTNQKRKTSPVDAGMNWTQIVKSIQNHFSLLQAT